MLFTVSDPNDTQAMRDYRGHCHAALAKIDLQRRAFLDSDNARPEIATATPHERRMAFGTLLMGAHIMSSHGVMPGAFPGQFIASLSRAYSEDAPEPGAAFGDLQHRRKAAAHLLTPILSTWPEFDPQAFRSGEPQPEAFMKALEADYAVLRNLVFDLYAPNHQMTQDSSGRLQPVFDQFRAASFGAIDAQALEDHLTHAVDAAEARACSYEREPGI